jgi:hypothetical protein
LSSLIFLDLKHSVDVIAHGIEFLGHRLGLFVLFLKGHISVETLEIVILAMLALGSTFVAFSLPLPARITSLRGSDWLTPLASPVRSHLVLAVVVWGIHWTWMWTSGWGVSIM